MLSLSSMDLLDKVQDVQFRFRIISARNLFGNNLKPVVKVIVGHEIFTTHIRRGNNPVFNEIFFIEFHQKLSEVFHKAVIIKVLNSRALRKDSLIGSFNIDIGSIYNAPGHVIQNKWISLCQTENSNSGVKGYLKVNMYVQQAGDPVPIEPENVPEDDDFESNLLISPSVQTHSVVVCFNIFRGEDIPQIDHPLRNYLSKIVHADFSQQIHMDPYVKVICGGKTLTTKVIQKTRNPVWNQSLSFPLQLPSMCAEFQLIVYNRQFAGKDEVLGSTSLNISQISSSGCEVDGHYNGFLPCFGPGFLPLYGNLHNPSKMQSLFHKADHAKEGAEYCGRLLFEVKTTMSTEKITKVEDIDLENISNVECYTSHKKFNLAAVFHSATMLPKVKDQVQFEVSMGNYGNKLDSTHKPVSSTTQYSQAVYDGNCYYYLPWNDTKPVVAMTFDWEDTTHRMQVVNLLMNLRQTMMNNLEALQNTSSNMDIKWKIHLKEITTACRQIIPLMENPYNTKLDEQLYKFRAFFLREMAESLKKLIKNHDPASDLVTQLDDWLHRLTGIIYEPQTGLPDVFIWMLFNNKRVAYARVSPADILYSDNSNCMGMNCGTLQTIFLKHLPGQDNNIKVPVQLRIRMWLSLASDITNLEKHFTLPGKICVCAETYENQKKSWGKWSSKLRSHPPYSDITGKLSAPCEMFQPPPGWQWEGEWGIEPQRRVLFKTRTLEGPCVPTLAPFTCNESETVSPSQCWEYAKSKKWRFHNICTPSDVYRRRRWRRVMVPQEEQGINSLFLLEGSMELKLLDGDGSKDGNRLVVRNNTPIIYCLCQDPTYYQMRTYIYQAKNLRSADPDSYSDPYAQVGFQYFSQFTKTMSCSQDPFWNETVIFNDVILYEDPKAVQLEPPCITVEVFDKTKKGNHSFLGRAICYPRVFNDITKREIPRLKWIQLRKGNTTAGKLLAAFELLLDNKQGNLDTIATPPCSTDGTLMVPDGICPVLKTMKLEILAWGVRELKPFHLLGVQNPSLLVTCGGTTIQTPPIEDIRENPNFPSPLLSMTVDLPEDAYYMPKLLLKVMDNRPYGYTPIIGEAFVRDLNRYICSPLSIMPPTAQSSKVVPIKHTVLEMPDLETQMEPQAVEYDWWCKFYASVGETTRIGDYLQKGHDTLKIYDRELETIPEFQRLQDVCQTFHLQRSRPVEDNEQDEENKDFVVVGEVKASFKIYQFNQDLGTPDTMFPYIPEHRPQQCLVRLYIVRALNLPPKDRNGLCDSYLKISLGDKKFDTRKNYVPGTLNPVFGNLFEIPCTIPLVSKLKITLMDYDIITADDKIGETCIDLEDRLLSCFGANCGIPQSYSVSGPNIWRHQLLPSQLLTNICSVKRLGPPKISESGERITIGNITTMLSEFETRPIPSNLGPPQERLSLYILRKMGQVPEHVETRSLYHQLRPGIEQGKLQMFLDIFPYTLGPPGPSICISPRVPEKYILRCIIWNTSNVDLQERSISGELMSDIYVKGWMDSMEQQKQRTDIHYRSLDGCGNFNYRFVFDFEYLKVDHMCAVTEKENIWNIDRVTKLIPPKLIIQIWDSDLFSPDDYLGMTELDLTKIPAPAPYANKCNINTLSGKSGGWFSRAIRGPQFFDMFKRKSAYGWWPCTIIEKNGKTRLSGKVEMTLEILSEKKAKLHPAGKGRDEPNLNPKLDPPIRPITSFLWLTNPLKGLKFALCKRFRRCFILSLIIMIVLSLLLVFIYNSPASLSKNLIGRLF